MEPQNTNQPQPNQPVYPQTPDNPSIQQPQQIQQPANSPIHQPILPENKPINNSPPQSVQSVPSIPDSSPTDIIKPPKSKGMNSFKGFLSMIELVGGALLLALAINSFVFQSYQVFGQSMSPTLSQGDRLIISKMSKSFQSLLGKTFTPDRGQIIVFVNPRNPDQQLVKRVIGLPGERVRLLDGKLTVFNTDNPEGFNPDEPYQESLVEVTSGMVDITVPDGHIFVSGDNRTPGGSLDSRNDLGTVPLEQVVGSLSVRIFPITEATFF